ncbi:hypothetical protein F2Q68_00014772 [Brassica cretica]|uniref:Uncharacterized protein n=1 Tax=Brassica cretica TaxID=69181 RepID=A0A8S9HIK9_BRACR|nr:hypothetical protein F2Q68_00014772 [Brassica cretica]
MERVTTLSVYSRRRLCLLSSSPSEERWKPTTIDDSRRLDGDSSVFCHLRCQRNDGEGDESVGLLRRSFRWLSRSIQLPDQLPNVRKISLSAILERKKSPNRLYQF